MSQGPGKGQRGATGATGPAANVFGLLFGGGADSNVTIAGGLTGLWQDLHAANLAVTGTGILNTNGWRIFVQGTLRIDAGGEIRADGQAGGSGGKPPQIGGVTAGLGATSNYLRGGFNGGSGAYTTRGSGGTTGPPYVLLGGAGGQGGSGNTGGGIGGTGMPLSSMRTRINYWPAMLEGYAGGMSGVVFYGGAGGGGGVGGLTSSATACGGGGGGGGGIIVVAAKDIINAGVIGARGGTGGIGGSGISAGGGGGGGGGAVVVIYDTYTGSGTLSAAGGFGGIVFGSTGSTGVSGADGRVFQFNV